MSEEVKMAGAEVTAKEIIKDNEKLLSDLENSFGRLTVRANLLASAEDTEAVERIVGALCRVADTIARIKRDAHMVEAGIAAQRTNARQMTDSLIGQMTGGGGAPSISPEVADRIRGAARGLRGTGLKKVPPREKG